ncbi:MAG: DUF2760 domain-containing protein [Oligoflexus sp.]
MIDIVVVLLGLGLNAVLVIRPDLLEILGGLPVALLINATLFLWLGLKVLNYRQKLQALVTARQDLQAMNEQTLTLNQTIEEQAARIATAEQALGERQTEMQTSRTEAQRLGQDLEQSRKQVARLEKDLQAAQAHQAAAEQSEAELVQFLSILQKQGRFLDFVMGDITRYPDDRVGAAARLVHQGCSKAIRDYFDIQPILSADEGSQIELPDEQHPRTIRFIGQGEEAHPKKGRLVHRGWQTLKVDLPKRTQVNDMDRVIITPAEVEVRT